MNKDELKQYIIKDHHKAITGHQVIYRFPNNYGASVVDGKMLHSFPFHTEIAVLAFVGDKSCIVYDTGITEDVIITRDDVEELEYLNKILELNNL